MPAPQQLPAGLMAGKDLMMDTLADADEQARIADQEHRDAVITKAEAALMDHAGLPIEYAQAAIACVTTGMVPAVSIKF